MKKITGIIIICVILVGIICASVGTDKLNIEKIQRPPEISCAHFSLDDCNDIFAELTEKQYKSIFEQPDLAFLKNLHDRYGIVVSLYVFYSWDTEKEGFDLSQSTDRYAEEFKQNADWLKIGFHAADANAYQSMTAEEILFYYNATIQEIIRIAGDEKCIDSFVRLDRYSADSDVILLLNQAKYGIDGLYIADRNTTYRESYALTEDQRMQCYADDWFVDDYGICYTPTDIRVENIESDEMLYDLLNSLYNQDKLVVFTHEWAMGEENTRRYMKLIAEYLYEYGVPSAFCTGQPE